MTRCIVTLAALLALVAIPASAQSPVAEMDGVTLRKVADIPSGGGPFSDVNRHPIRIAQDPTDGALYVLATSEPDGREDGSTNRIYRLDLQEDGTFDPVEVLEGSDHGTPGPVGMDLGPEGNLYLVGNNEYDLVDDDSDNATHTEIVIRRGVPNDSGGWDWSTVATSETYLLSFTYFDHRANAVAVTPDGSTLIVNSGSRTDHGESYGGVRDEPLNVVLLQVPSDATDLVLVNDREALKEAGYVYAEGNRNTADLAFAPNGDLLGPDNAGDRDDPGELNWLREGEHYGFPWRIGGNDTPMQYNPYGAPSGYNDPNNDPLLPPGTCNNPNPADTGCYFSTDPDFPAPPEGVTFVEPIPNAGPYADKFLDSETGAVRDASDEGITITSFSGGRSPLGLAFDADSLLEGRLKGGAFMLSFAGDRGGFPDEGRDVSFLDLDKGEDGYTMTVEAVASGFTFPIDAVMVEETLYVIEYGRWFASQPIPESRGVWAVTFPTATDSELAPVASAIEFSAFPNPATNRLSLAYNLAQPSAVRIEVFDVLGRVVHTVDRLSGEGRVELSAAELGAGVYVARLTAGDIRETRTFTVIR